jgi:hypothetical protein
MGIRGASRQPPREPVYDEDFTKRAEKAMEKALDNTRKGHEDR